VPPLPVERKAIELYFKITECFIIPTCATLGIVGVKFYLLEDIVHNVKFSFIGQKSIRGFGLVGLAKWSNLIFK
jgi:hypothetical protein